MSYDRMIQSWTYGIHLWEQEGAYLEAMQLWETALLELPLVAPELSSSSETLDDERVVAQLLGDRKEHDSWDEIPLLPPRVHRGQNDQDDDDEEEEAATRMADRVAPLLLFLAGCFMDAGQYCKARQYCRATWKFAHLRRGQEQETPNTEWLYDNNNNNTSPWQADSYKGIHAHTILVEYMAAWEEDPDIAHAWRICRPIVQQAFQQQQQQSSKTPWSLAWHSPYQRPPFVWNFQTTNSSGSLPPVCPRDQHPAWCRGLEDQYAVICQEFLDLCHGHKGRSNGHTNNNNNNNNNNHTFPSHWPVVGDGAHREGAGSHDGSVVRRAVSGSGVASNGEDGGGVAEWREWVLFGSGATTGGAPQTRAWIQQHIPQAVELAQAGGGEVIFSVLAPNTHIAPHCASTNLRWTAHLGLVVAQPDDTNEDSKKNDPTTAVHRIRVADTWYTWKPGGVFVFDDSHEHEVWNTSMTEYRAVLLLRFWHPHFGTVQEQTRALQHALAWKQLDQDKRQYPPHPPVI